jgi:hypothetical protein
MLFGSIISGQMPATVQDKHFMDLRIYLRPLKGV